MCSGRKTHRDGLHAEKHEPTEHPLWIRKLNDSFTLANAQPAETQLTTPKTAIQQRKRRSDPTRPRENPRH
jgi:hypothetical protein